MVGGSPYHRVIVRDESWSDIAKNFGGTALRSRSRTTENMWFVPCSLRA